MPRNLSSTLLGAINQPDGGNNVYVNLLEIKHSTITTIRICDNTEDVISGGNSYTAYPFRIQLVDDREGEFPRPSIEIDNIDGTIMQALRSILTKATITHSAVLFNTPDVPEIGPIDYTLVEVEYDAFSIVGILSLGIFASQAVPFHPITNATAPGAFGSAT